MISSRGRAAGSGGGGGGVSVEADGVFKKPSTSSSGMKENEGWSIVFDNVVIV